MVMVAMKEPNREIYFSLLSGTIGLFLPHPTIVPDHTNTAKHAAVADVLDVLGSSSPTVTKQPASSDLYGPIVINPTSPPTSYQNQTSSALAAPTVQVMNQLLEQDSHTG